MWQLDGTRARLESPQLSCQLDIASPANGVTDLTIVLGTTQPFCWSEAALMQLRLPNEKPVLGDAYVRGNDLVATYDESAGYKCRTQLYWRFDSDDAHVGIQFIVSTQTSRLDAVPGLDVVSQVGSTARRLDDGTVFPSIPALDIRYAELS